MMIRRKAREMSADDLVAVLRKKAAEMEDEGKRMAEHHDDIIAIADRLAELTERLERPTDG